MNPAHFGTALIAFSMGRGFDPLPASSPDAPASLPAVPLVPSLEGSSSA